MSVCDKDCFQCPYPDCINDEMDHADYIEAASRDKNLRATPKSRKLAAQNKAYREANREKLAAQQSVIRHVRQLLGLSLRGAAEILGVAVMTVSNWERGLVPCDAGFWFLARQPGTQSFPFLEWKVTHWMPLPEPPKGD